MMIRPTSKHFLHSFTDSTISLNSTALYERETSALGLKFWKTYFITKLDRDMIFNSNATKSKQA